MLKQIVDELEIKVSVCFEPSLVCALLIDGFPLLSVLTASSASQALVRQRKSAAWE